MDQAGNQRRRLGGGSYGFRLGLLVAAACLALALPVQPAAAIENKPFVAPVTDPLPKGTRVNVLADKITYDPTSTEATATGTVHITYGPYVLNATRVSYNTKTGAFDANGSVEMTEPNGNKLYAQSIDLRNKFRDGFARKVKALLTNNVTITAEFVKRSDGNITVFEKATYTACHDCKTRSGHPLWEIDTDQTTHDAATHNLYHVHPRMKINGVTVVSLPYWQMPDPSVTRRSGWLAPDLKVGSDYGYGLVTPYFWAITPSTDLTFRPVITTRQGPIADIEWRQALENGSYRIRGYGVHQFTKLDPPDEREWRGAVDAHGTFKAGQDWTYGWDATAETDQTFLNSYGYDGRYYATNSAYATGLWDQTYVNAQMLNFGSLSTSINPNTLPNAMPFVSGETIWRDTPIGGQVNFSWNAYSLHRVASATPFTTVNQGTDQTRGTAQMNWHKQYFNDAGMVVTPFTNMRSDILISNNVPDASASSGYTSTTATRLLPEVGLDARYPLIANLPFGQSIVSPVFQIVSSANEGDTSAFGNEDSITLNYDHTSLFLADRFTGMDRYEGGTHADIGLTYSLIGNNGGFIRASAGQSIHIAGQNSFVDGSGLADNESDLVAAIVVRPWDELSLSYEARMKDDLSAINRQEAVASLNFDGFATNFSYLDFAAEPAYGQPRREHWISSDAKVALSGGWSLFGGVTYDFENAVMTQRTLGVEFDCECMNVRLAYSGTTDAIAKSSSQQVLLSVEFATLGKTGASVGF